MTFDVLTLFPEMFECVFGMSIIGRAIKNSLIDINLYNIRDYAKNKHKQVDDYPYGGGCGMVMAPQPLFDTFNVISQKYGDKLPKVIYLSPQGHVFNQDLAGEFAKESNLVLLCGHYEGIDQRVIDKYVDMEISIGDYVLTGGELPAMVFIDCISRLVPGVLGSSQSAEEESFSRGLLEYPQYTRPYEYEGYKVPDVLLSGNHKEIDKWRTIYSLKNTLDKRPDMLNNVKLTGEEQRILDMLKEQSDLMI